MVDFKMWFSTGINGFTKLKKKNLESNLILEKDDNNENIPTINNK